MRAALECRGRGCPAHQKHRGRAGDAQGLHQIRCGPENAHPGAALNPGGRRAALAPAQIEPGVVELHDAGDEAVHADRHEERDADEHRGSHREGLARHRAQRDDDDLRREDEIGAHGALDPRLLGRRKV